MSNYLGTYKQKPTTKLAPDAIVLIEGQATVVICPICKGQILVSDYITTIATSLATNTTVGTASFSITMPRHGDNGKYMIRGGRVWGIYLMNEIEIYIKGRFPVRNSDGSGTYQYHKVFWGIVSGINESYSDGVQTIEVTCESMMKWLQLMQTNEHPAVRALATLNASGQNLTAALIAGKTYAYLNVYEIINNMVSITYLNMVIPNTFVTQEKVVVNGQSVNISVINPKELELTNAWATKFTNIKANLRMFGAKTSDYTDTLSAKSTQQRSTLDPTGKGYQDPTTPIAVNYDTTALMDFRPFLAYENSKNLDITISTYRNNLEIINETRLFVGFEFFLDSIGEFIFKPPFWNMDVRQNPVFVIQDEDIYSLHISESEAEVKTRVEVSGSLTAFTNTDNTTYKGVYTDYNLARQFGLKSVQLNVRFFQSADQCYYHAISELDRINSGRFRGSITVVGRPELRLGIPLYIQSRDCFVYIENISHNFAFGSTFTTTVEFTAMRRKYVGTDPLASAYNLNSPNNIPGLTGRAAILLWQNSITASNITQYTNNAQAQAVSANLISSPTPAVQTKLDSSSTTKEFFRTNTAGTYTEVLLSDPSAQAVMAQAQAAKANASQSAYLTFLDSAIPVSDEEGYELIGSFENGRSLTIDANYTINKKTAASFAALLNQSAGAPVPFKFNTNANVLGYPDPNASFQHPAMPPGSQVNSVSNPPAGGVNTPPGGSTSTEVAQYMQFAAESITNLAPSNTTIPKCQCSDPGFYSIQSAYQAKTGQATTSLKLQQNYLDSIADAND